MGAVTSMDMKTVNVFFLHKYITILFAVQICHATEAGASGIKWKLPWQPFL